MSAGRSVSPSETLSCSPWARRCLRLLLRVLVRTDELDGRLLRLRGHRIGGRPVRLRRRGVRHLHLVGAPAARCRPPPRCSGCRSRRRERHPAVVALAPVVVRRVGNPVAVGIVDAAQIGSLSVPSSARDCPQIDDVGPPRHQLDRKPVAVARTPDPARRRVADRNPPARGRSPGEVLTGRLRYRLRRALIGLRNRRIDYHRLVHVRDVDRHAGVGRLIPVARPHGQLEAGGTGLVVLAPAHIEQLAAGRVELEPPRLVAALDAVAHRTAVRVRRRHRAQR